MNTNDGRQTANEDYRTAGDGPTASDGASLTTDDERAAADDERAAAGGEGRAHDYLVERHGADLRLRLLTLRDLAHAFLEELGTVREAEPANVEQGVDFYDEVRRFEIELIVSALRRTGGKQREAAALLGLKPTTLHAKIKQYQLSAADFLPRPASSSADAENTHPDSSFTRAPREESARDGHVLAA
jgi:DNA-binding protein Fis